jgi:uncharacterized protein (TIGR00730 family)
MTVHLEAVCVFCGCNQGAKEQYRRVAAQTGRILAGRGIRLIYGGARAGLMGMVADAALAAGGTVVGVMPRSIVDQEPPHDGLSELHLVSTMHERKALMAERSDAFVALPGGLGTLEEVFEVISWTQLGPHDKPAGFVNAGGFYEPVMAQLDHMVAEGFIRPEHRGNIYFADQPGGLLGLLAGFEPARIHKWIDRDQAGGMRRASGEGGDW